MVASKNFPHSISNSSHRNSSTKLIITLIFIVTISIFLFIILPPKCEALINTVSFCVIFEHYISAFMLYIFLYVWHFSCTCEIHQCCYAQLGVSVFITLQYCITLHSRLQFIYPFYYF